MGSPESIDRTYKPVGSHRPDISHPGNCRPPRSRTPANLKVSCRLQQRNALGDQRIHSKKVASTKARLNTRTMSPSRIPI